MATTTLTKDTFEDTVKDNEIVLIDFWAEWCGPCKMFGPIFEKVSDAHPDITFGKVDTEVERDLAGAFHIMSIPTLMIIRDQITVFSQAGAIPEDGLEDLIRQVKELDMDDVRAKIAEEAKDQAKDNA